MAFVASGSERVKNYARVGDSTPWPCTFTQAVPYMALSALGCCTANQSQSLLYVGDYKQPFETLDFRLRREARKEGNYYVPGDPKLAFVMRIRGINQVCRANTNQEEHLLATLLDPSGLW